MNKRVVSYKTTTYKFGFGLYSRVAESSNQPACPTVVFTYSDVAKSLS